MDARDVAVDALGATPARADSRRPERLKLALRALAMRVAGAVWWSVPCIAAGLAAAIPVISSTVKAVRAGWVPAGDDGIIATRGWDVLSSHTPLVGQYSEAGLVIHGQVMHSPGPDALLAAGAAGPLRQRHEPGRDDVHRSTRSRSSAAWRSRAGAAGWC